MEGGIPSTGHDGQQVCDKIKTHAILPRVKHDKVIRDISPEVEENACEDHKCKRQLSHGLP